MIFGVISDTHNHNWTTFAEQTDKGNSRLLETLVETYRAGEITKKRGGKYLIHCGDLFHVRGNVPPSVLNPTIECYQKICNELGLKVIFLTGNHDCEFSETNKLGNAMCAVVHALPSGCECICEPKEIDGVGCFVPWNKSVDEQKKNLEYFINKNKFCTIFTHAPIDEVVVGVPNSGLNNEYFEHLDFQGLLFAGHYHHHKKLSENIYSVGALTQHSWCDIGSKAGFMVVDTETKFVDFYDSQAPKFIDITADTPKEDLAELICGNYLRITIEKSVEEAKEIRELFTSNELGAKGVIFNLIDTKPKLKREGSLITVSPKNPLNVTICQYIDEKLAGKEQSLIDEVKKQALELIGA